MAKIIEPTITTKYTPQSGQFCYVTRNNITVLCFTTFDGKMVKMSDGDYWGSDALETGVTAAPIAPGTRIILEQQ